MGVSLLDPGDPSVRQIAGGTALMLMIKPGFFHPQAGVSLAGSKRSFSLSERLPEARCASARWRAWSISIIPPKFAIWSRSSPRTALIPCAGL
jgi:hypothetical protein